MIVALWPQWPVADAAQVPADCRKCRQAKPADQFYLNKLVSDGLSTYCKECTQASRSTIAILMSFIISAAAHPDSYPTGLTPCFRPVPNHLQVIVLHMTGDNSILMLQPCSVPCD